MRSTLTAQERGLLRDYLAYTRTARRTVATWHPVKLADRHLVRVTFTTWGRRDVDHQDGETVEGLKAAWHLVCNELALPAHIAANRHAFRGWASLGRR